MKKIIIVLILVVGFIFLYLTLAINTKKKEFEEYKKQIKADSALYHSKQKTDSIYKIP